MLPKLHTCMSYPNFVRRPLFVDMQPLFDHLKIFNIHRCGIRKVPRCFGKKLVKNTNFIQGPFLIASEGLTLIAVESVKFHEISERKHPKLMGVHSDSDQATIIHKIVEMETRDSKEAEAMGNRPLSS